jgi:hypothetical protein
LRHCESLPRKSEWRLCHGANIGHGQTPKPMGICTLWSELCPHSHPNINEFYKADAAGTKRW